MKNILPRVAFGLAIVNSSCELRNYELEMKGGFFNTKKYEPMYKENEGESRNPLSIDKESLYKLSTSIINLAIHSSEKKTSRDISLCRVISPQKYLEVEKMMLQSLKKYFHP